MQGAIASPGSDATMRAVKLACRDVWKVFGPNAARELARHGQRPTDEDLAKAADLAVAGATKMAASNAAHLARLLKERGYSGYG